MKTIIFLLVIAFFTVSCGEKHFENITPLKEENGIKTWETDDMVNLKINGEVSYEIGYGKRYISGQLRKKREKSIFSKMLAFVVEEEILIKSLWKILKMVKGNPLLKFPLVMQ